MRQFPNYRIHWLLLILPLSIALSSLFFIIAPILIAGSLLKIADSTFAYSVNQTGRETLYNPLSRQEKYVARAFVEVFVQRTGKVAALLIAFLVPMFLNKQNEAGHLETSLLSLQLLGGFHLHHCCPLVLLRQNRRKKIRGTGKRIKPHRKPSAWPIAIHE